MAKDIKIGISGARRGGYFVGVFQTNPHTTVTAICDPQEQVIQDIAGKSGVEQIYTDFEEMIEKSGVDAVFVSAPMQFHVPQSIMALERGISVLSEVPAAVSVEECRRLVETCRKSRATYMMAENCCYMRPNVLVREIANAGLFGELYFAEGEYIHDCKSLNLPGGWRRRWQTGVNGNTYPTHSLGPVYQWFGKQRVTSVCCAGSGSHYPDADGKLFENEDSTFTACRLEGGGLVNLRLDMVSNRPHNMLYNSLQGTKGCYEAPRGFGDKHKIFLAGRHEENTWHDLEELAQEFLPDLCLNPPEEIAESSHGGGDYMEVLDFVDVLITGREPEIGIHEAMDMSLPGLMSQISIEQGSVWLDVPNSREW